MKSLTPKEIKLLLFKNDLTIAGLAREASGALGYHIWPETLSRVIHGKPGYEQPELREWLTGKLREITGRERLKAADLPRAEIKRKPPTVKAEEAVAT